MRIVLGLESPDGGDVVAELGLGSALTERVLVGDDVVLPLRDRTERFGGGLPLYVGSFGLDIAGFLSSGRLGSSSSDGRNAHHMPTLPDEEFRKAQFVAVRVGEVEIVLAPFRVARGKLGLQALRHGVPVHAVHV